MAGKIHVLHPQSAPLAGVLRVGHTGHRKLEAMLAAGRFPYKRVVFDAAHIEEQSDFVKSLVANGCEVVLDPNFAELATVGRFQSAAAKMPGANLEKPWEPSDFAAHRNLDLARSIAEFSIKQGVSVVLAPAHMVEQDGDAWKSIDLEMCFALRRELDRLGGAGISIDYQLLTTSALLKDHDGRAALISGLDELPIENIWLRTAGFGCGETGAGTRNYIEAVRHLHQAGRPIMADCVGGFAGLAAGAFGAVSGISHGVGQKENFNARSWSKPSLGGGGMGRRVYIPELDRYFKGEQLEAIFEARKGKSLFGCNKKGCCSHGIEDMLNDPGAHFITQRRSQIDELSSVPDLRREEHFILRMVDPAVKSARPGSQLKIADERLAKAVSGAKTRLIRLRDALWDLHESTGAVPHSESVPFRGSGRAVNSQFGRTRCLVQFQK